MSEDLIRAERAKIEAEIAMLQARLDGMNYAMSMLMPKRLSLPNPAREKPPKAVRKKPRKAAKKPTEDEPDEIGAEINGVFVRMTERQADMFDLLNAQPEGGCVSQEALRGFYEGMHISNFFSDLRALREALAPARATIGNVRGEGYRLENLEADG